MKTCFTIQTLDEGRDLAKQLAQQCPNPETAFIGLIELLINAIEHGNLGITYAQKSHLQSQDRWEEEMERRLALPEYAEKRVTLQTWRTEETLCFHIQDQGHGFDWKPFLTINPERVLHSHGRGIAMACHMSFDTLEYQGNGNEVLATIRINETKPSESD